MIDVVLHDATDTVAMAVVEVLGHREFVLTRLYESA